MTRRPMGADASMHQPAACAKLPPMSIPLRLAELLRTQCEDALFVVASMCKFDLDQLTSVAKHRASEYEQLVRGPLPAHSPDDWWVRMCQAMAPSACPPWLPMHELLDELTLVAGARGVRSLFSSKPSDKQIQRTRNMGTFAVRAMSTVMACSGALHPEDRLLRRCVVATLGLPESEAEPLLREDPKSADELVWPLDLEPRDAKLLARGLWNTAVRDGLDPREDELVWRLCERLGGLATEDIDAMRREARAWVDARKLLGQAAVDAIRYVLAGDPDRAGNLGRLAAMLVLAPVHRRETIASIEYGGPIILAKRHALERTEREACLVMAWLAALSLNPTYVHSAELIARHDRVAADLGGKAEGNSCRLLAQGYVTEHMMRGVQAAGL